MISIFFLSTVTPTTCKKLIDAGYDVTVERSTQRIFEGMTEKIVTGSGIDFKSGMLTLLAYVDR